MTATAPINYQMRPVERILLPAWFLIDRPWSLLMLRLAPIMAVLAMAILSTAFA